MGLVTTLAVASLAVAAIGTAESIHQGNVAQDAQNKARSTQAAQASINQQNQIRDQVRAQRVKTSQIQQASQDTGVSNSSGQIGAGSVLASQAGSNVGDLNGIGITTQALSNDYQNAANARGKQNMYDQFAQLGSAGFNIFSNTPQFKKSYNSIFGG